MTRNDMGTYGGPNHGTIFIIQPWQSKDFQLDVPSSLMGQTPNLKADAVHQNKLH